MTKLYLDTEFNGFGGELISLALVGEILPHSMAVGGTTQSTWYQSKLFNGPTDTWVAEHVIPFLNSTPLMPSAFRESFHEFISRFKNPEIICDWHADAEHFAGLLAGKDYGTSLDFPCQITILNTPPNAIISDIPHNALADAQALMRWHSKLLKCA